MSRVLNGQPWSIYGQILLRISFRGHHRKKLLSKRSPYGFSFRGLPYTYWSEGEIVELLQNAVRIVEISLQFTFPTSSLGYRVRTELNISNPLPVGVNIVILG